MDEIIFKIGDKVVVSGNLMDDYIATIERITPTGRIVTNKAGTYDKNGHELGSSYHRKVITHVTPEKINEINMRNRRKYLKNFDWINDLSDTVITQIRNIVREAENKV